jgi:hypothetical protein
MNRMRGLKTTNEKMNHQLALSMQKYFFTEASGIFIINCCMERLGVFLRGISPDIHNPALSMRWHPL